MNDVDVVLAQIIVKLLKFEKFDEVSIEKCTLVPDSYTITVYLENGAKYIRQIVSEEEIEMANYDVPEAIANNFQRHLDKWEKEKKNV